MNRVAPTDVPATWTALLKFLLAGTGVWAMLACALVAVAYKALLGTWGWLDVVIILAFFGGRGVIEWTIHSWLYHANPLPLLGWRLDSVVSDMHRKHHANPFDISTLLITWKGVVAVLLVTLLTSSLALWSIDLGMSMMLGFAIVAFMIEFLHLICHCRIPHRSQLIRNLVRLHRSHHHQCQSMNYGVSSSLGDKLFGTSAPVAAATEQATPLADKVVHGRK